MANLLRQSPDDAISVTATSQGSLSLAAQCETGWSMTRSVADAMVQLTASEAGEAFSAQAGGRFEKFLPPTLQPGSSAGRQRFAARTALIEPDAHTAR